MPRANTPSDQTATTSTNHRGPPGRPGTDRSGVVASTSGTRVVHIESILVTPGRWPWIVRRRPMAPLRDRTSCKINLAPRPVAAGRPSTATNSVTSSTAPPPPPGGYRFHPNRLPFCASTLPSLALRPTRGCSTFAAAVCPAQIRPICGESCPRDGAKRGPMVQHLNGSKTPCAPAWTRLGMITSCVDTAALSCLRVRAVID